MAQHLRLTCTSLLPPLHACTNGCVIGSAVSCVLHQEIHRLVNAMAEGDGRWAGGLTGYYFSLPRSVRTSEARSCTICASFLSEWVLSRQAETRLFAVLQLALIYSLSSVLLSQNEVFPRCVIVNSADFEFAFGANNSETLIGSTCPRLSGVPHAQRSAKQR